MFDLILEMLSGGDPPDAFSRRSRPAIARFVNSAIVTGPISDYHFGMNAMTCIICCIITR